MTSEEPVAPGIGVPLRDHWKVGGGAPVVGKVKTTVLPLAIDWELGCPAAAGGEVGPVSEINVAE